MNALDLVTIQECMVSYERLLYFFPAVGKDEEKLRQGRLSDISHVIDVCEKEIKRMREEARDE